MPHRYTLDNTRPGKLFACPQCRKKTFKRYVDTQTSDYLPAHVGRCNREVNCAYHYPPRRYFEENPTVKTQGYSTAYAHGSTFVPLHGTAHHDPVRSRKWSLPVQPVPVKTVVQQPSFITHSMFTSKLNNYSANHFTNYLNSLFGTTTTAALIKKYFIGTSNVWPGATIFWQIDTAGRVRTGKIMVYNPQTGKRVKEPHNHTTWQHCYTGQKDYNLQQCLFGEHLLTREPHKTIALVESEKTAIIASVFMPQFIWCATGSKSLFTANICKALKGRSVVLFPDLSNPAPGKPTAFEQWSNRANELAALAAFTVSTVLEQKATAANRLLGLDIADYLIQEKAAAPKTIQSPAAPETHTAALARLQHFINHTNTYTGQIEIAEDYHVNFVEHFKVQLLLATWNIGRKQCGYFLNRLEKMEQLKR